MGNHHQLPPHLPEYRAAALPQRFTGPIPAHGPLATPDNLRNVIADGSLRRNALCSNGLSDVAVRRIEVGE